MYKIIYIKFMYIINAHELIERQTAFKFCKFECEKKKMCTIHLNVKVLSMKFSSVVACTNTQRNLFEILLNQLEIRL